MLENGDGFRGSRLSGLRVSFTAGRNVSLNLSNQTARVSIPSKRRRMSKYPALRRIIKFLRKKYFVLNHRPGLVSGPKMPNSRPSAAERGRRYAEVEIIACGKASDFRR